MSIRFLFSVFTSTLLFLIPISPSYAQDIPVPKAEVSFSPNVGTFQEGSQFDVPIYLNTQGKSVSKLELHITFDPTKLQVIPPAGRNSIVTVWNEAPNYSNINGTITLVGSIPGGITTTNALVGTITFKALFSGDARVMLTSDSHIFTNDGLSGVIPANFGTGLYTILQKPPSGVRVFSYTHPNQEKWYNNNSPLLQWEKPPGVTAFSYAIDDKPYTIPDNTIDTQDVTVSLPNLKEGISYFHIKALKDGAWGGTTHFLLRIDTAPPAEFKPIANIYAAVITSAKALVSFNTTDALSGIDHFEVGTVDKNGPADISPAFLEAQSPFTVPEQNSGQVRVLVRAFDKAGNVRDEFIDITLLPTAQKFLQTYSIDIILLLIVIFLLFLLSRHYLFRHHVLGNIKKALRMIEDGAENDTPSDTP